MTSKQKAKVLKQITEYVANFEIDLTKYQEPKLELDDPNDKDTDVHVSWEHKTKRVTLWVNDICWNNQGIIQWSPLDIDDKEGLA